MVAAISSWAKTHVASQLFLSSQGYQCGSQHQLLEHLSYLGYTFFVGSKKAPSHYTHIYTSSYPLLLDVYYIPLRILCIARSYPYVSRQHVDSEWHLLDIPNYILSTKLRGFSKVAVRSIC